MVRDKDSTLSKGSNENALRGYYFVVGYFFFEYIDPTVSFIWETQNFSNIFPTIIQHTEGAIEGLNNMSIGNKTLTVRRAQAKGYFLCKCVGF